MRASLFATALLLLAACGGGSATTPPESGTPASLAVSAGNGQTAAAGAAVATAPAVLVKDADGNPLANVTVTFAVTAGGGSVAGATPKTGAGGVARVTSWTLGPAGTQRLQASVNGLTAVTFEATIAAPGTTTQETIPATGGTITVDGDTNPYDGLTLTIPSGTFTTPQTWTLQVVPDAAVPALPAGIVRNGPPLAITGPSRGAALMTLQVPVPAVAAGHRTLLAFYDPVRQIMEILPTVASTATSVTVVSTHFDPALLIGAPMTGSLWAPFASMTSANRIGGGGLVIPLDLAKLPLPEGSTSQARWPVPDLPTPASPKGHGLAILALSTRNIAGGILNAVKAVQPTNHLADTIPYATLEIVNTKLESSAEIPIKSYMARLNTLPKEERDGFASSHIAASVAVGRAPVPVAYVENFQFGGIGGFGTTVASLTSALSIGDAADANTRQVPVTASGFGALSAKIYDGAAATAAAGIAPLPSFVVPYEVVNADLQRFVDGMSTPAGSMARRTANEAIAKLANLMEVKIEQQTTPDGPWTPAPTPIVLRKAFGKLRLIGNGVAQKILLANASTLLETMRSDGIFDMTSLPSAQTAAPKQLFAGIGSIFQGIGTLLLQTHPVRLDYVKEPFDITPENPKLTTADREVQLTASVGRPPEEGFRMRWEWGDDTQPTEQLTLVTASHTYATVGTYRVIAILQRNDQARTVLAADTIEVGTDQAPFWRLTAIQDQDDLFDPDNEAGGEIFDMLKRLVATPAAGLIGVTENGPASELFLRGKRTTTWTTCCPPVYDGNDWKVVLGVKPTAQNTVGPFFAAWNTSSWSQTTTDLGSGTMTGQFAQEFLNYQVKNGGTQRGPGVGIRITATRNGTTMTGTITFHTWFQGELENGVIDSDSEDTWRFPFTAVRMQ